MESFQKLIGVRKKIRIPGVAGPTHRVILLRLVHFAERLELGCADVPGGVEVDDIEGHITVTKSLDEVVDLLVRVVPPAGPPRAEGIARRQRDAAGDADVIAQRLAIIVTVAEEIPIGVGAGFLLRRALRGPRPRAFLAIAESEVGRIE